MSFLLKNSSSFLFGKLPFGTAFVEREREREREREFRTPILFTYYIFIVAVSLFLTWSKRENSSNYFPKTQIFFKSIINNQIIK